MPSQNVKNNQNRQSIGVERSWDQEVQMLTPKASLERGEVSLRNVVGEVRLWGEKLQYLFFADFSQNLSFGRAQGMAAEQR